MHEKQFFSENMESMLLENAPLYRFLVRAWQAMESNSAGSRDSQDFSLGGSSTREARSAVGAPGEHREGTRERGGAAGPVRTAAEGDINRQDLLL